MLHVYYYSIDTSTHVTRTRVTLSHMGCINRGIHHTCYRKTQCHTCVNTETCHMCQQRGTNV